MVMKNASRQLINAVTGIPGFRVTPRNDFCGKVDLMNEGGEESQ